MRGTITMKKIPLQCEYLDKNFYCLIDCTKKQAINWINKNYGDRVVYNGESSGCTAFFYGDDGCDNIFLWISRDKKLSVEIYTVFHEVGHAVFRMMSNTGVNPGDSSGEHFLYLQEYIVEQIMKSFVKKNKSKK